MSPNLACDEVRDVAPEMALGVVSGEERALVLDHVAGCLDCRKHLDELARTADGLLVLAPAAEPPAGFETRVLNALERARRPGRRRIATLVAAVVAGAVIAGIAAVTITSEDRGVAGRYRAALAEANGEYFGVRRLVDERGTKAGHVFAYQGSPSWLVVVVDRAGQHRIEVATQDGRALDLGEMRSGSPPLVWGGEIPVAVHDIDVVTVGSATGELYEASFSSHD